MTGKPVVNDLQSVIKAEMYLPSRPLGNVKARVIALLWEMEAEAIEKEHPGSRMGAVESAEAIQAHYDKGGSEDDCPSLTAPQNEIMNALTNAHSWRDNGCCWVDFFFPTFCGKSLTKYTLGEDGVMRPVGDDQ